MAEGRLWVAATRRDRVCMLTISGELDSLTADVLPRRVLAAIDQRAGPPAPAQAQAQMASSSRGTGGRMLAEALRGPVGDRADSLVADLSQLIFVDVAGARALADVIRTVAGIWPVTVPRVSTPVRRVFKLSGINTQALCGYPGCILPRPIQDLVREGEAARSRARHLQMQSHRIAGLLAATEDQMAATLTCLAGQRPGAARRLAALSQTARQHAAGYRQAATAGI